MAPKRHAKPLYDFDGLVAAARRQSIDVREDNGHFYFSNKHGMVDMRREEVTAGRRSWNSHVSRLRRIGLVWASKVDKPKADQLEQQFAAESSQLIQQFQAIETTYPSLAHVASGPGFLFELPVEESAQVIEMIEETKKTGMTEKDRGLGIGEKRHVNTGSPEGWSASESRTKAYQNRMHRESRKFLREFLKDGPKELHEIKNAALAAGLTWYQVDKASNPLKIVKKTHGPRYPGTWELPESGKRDSGSVRVIDEATITDVSVKRDGGFAPSLVVRESHQEPALSADANGEPRNANPGPGTYPPPATANRGIVSPDETRLSVAAGQDFQSPHRSPFALGIADLVEQELTFRVKEYVERVERLEREKSELLQQLADMQHEQDRNWEKIQQEALEAAQKSVAEAIAAAKKR